jgi:hypothetical protein
MLPAFGGLASARHRRKNAPEAIFPSSPQLTKQPVKIVVAVKFDLEFADFAAAFDGDLCAQATGKIGRDI